MSSTIRISYFFLIVGRGNSKPPIFFNRIDTMNLRLFLRKMYVMLITINMKGDIAFVSINNSPCGIQKGSTKDDRLSVGTTPMGSLGSLLRLVGARLCKEQV